MRPNRARGEGLEPRLATTLLRGIDIDTILETEHTKLVEPGEFPGIIIPFSSDKNEIARDAKPYTDIPEEV